MTAAEVICGVGGLRSLKNIQEVRLKAVRGMSPAKLRREWFANPKADILAGAVVGLALIPEAIAFSIRPVVN